MLEIVLTPKLWAPHEIGTLGLSLFSLMVNPRLTTHYSNRLYPNEPYLNLE